MTRTIFVVDDDRDFVELVAVALTDAETAVRSFDDPIRALEALRGEKADLLISDLSMPWLDGRSLVEAARRLQPAIHVLLISAFPRVAEIAARQGVSYLQKPLKLPDLIRASAETARS